MDETDQKVNVLEREKRLQNALIQLIEREREDR